MASSEELFRAISSTFVNTLRETELGEIFKGPELLFWFNKKFGEIYAEGILNLEPIYLEMQGNKEIEKSDLMGFMLLFREQEQKLGIQMQLPSELLLTKSDRRDKLLRRMQKQVDQRRAAPAREAAAAAAAALNAQPTRASKIVLGGGGKSRLVLGLCAIGLAAVSVGVNIWTHTPPQPDLQPVSDIKLEDLGLTGKLTAKQSIYVLTIPKNEWDLIPQELQRTRVLSLMSIVQPRGGKSLIVSDEDYVTLAVAWGTIVTFVPYIPVRTTVQDGKKG